MEVALINCTFFSELCWGKAMVACTMPQQRKKDIVNSIISILCSRVIFFSLKQKDSIDSDNGIVFGSSPPGSGRRRRNTESSESYEDSEKSSDGLRSFSCTRLRENVESVSFVTKHCQKFVCCGKCLGMN